MLEGAQTTPAQAAAAPSDEELEARWKAGSAPAFAALFERYHARVFCFALRLTGDRHAAEDLAQRAFLNLYQKPPPGTGRATFKALIFTVVRNESLNELKRRGRRRESALDRSPEGADPRERPVETVDQQEQRARLARALGRLAAAGDEVRRGALRELLLDAAQEVRLAARAALEPGRAALDPGAGGSA